MDYLTLRYRRWRDTDRLRIHSFQPASRANGPGVRAVIWTQGCTLGCAGCFNPETHAVDGGEQVVVDDLFQQVQALDGIQGITVSGGEPLQQQHPLLTLLKKIKNETPLSVVLFTGFTWDEVQRMPGVQALLARVDVLIAGRYDAAQRLASDLRGSANKTAHFLSDRYTLADLQAVPPGEVLITPDGDVVVSGIDPLEWREKSPIIPSG